MVVGVAREQPGHGDAADEVDHGEDHDQGQVGCVVVPDRLEGDPSDEDDEEHVDREDAVQRARSSVEAEEASAAASPSMMVAAAVTMVIVPPS